MRRFASHRALRWASLTVAVSASLVTGSLAAASSAAASTSVPATVNRGIAVGTRFFVPPPSDGAPQQVVQLVKAGDLKDAALIMRMETIPRAVWFDSGTPAQVQQQVRQTMTEAAIERAVPVLVAYDIPGRDCDQYSAGGAQNEAGYEAWIDGFAQE